ncbi:MAG TPA: SAM-dependent methyltransferase [Pyrinomonadaceae bacterium]|nr:SAM-dependent methyltransferase [Pyrinomonadaceae bacterium]
MDEEKGAAGPDETVPLGERLRERVRAAGAISFRDWMEAALYDPRGGYYSRADLTRWGRAGDYRTAPERSPLFAATFADYFARVYEELGSPDQWTIFEAGAGAGHFAQGVLRTLRDDHPRVFAATRYVIDERSEDARSRARSVLDDLAARVQFQQLSDISSPAGTGIVIANELLDALPVHRVTLRGGVLRELYVAWDDREGKFAWAEGEPGTPRLAEYFARSGVVLSEGQTAEVNLEAEAWLKVAARAFEGGRLVLVDYGAEAEDLFAAPHRRGGTLRAFHRHRFADDVLARPGEQDLTTTIDWTRVRKVSEELGLEVVSFERQDGFLLRAGLLGRLERMSSEAATEADAVVLRSTARELILPGGMSDSFQVLVQKK